MKALKKLAVFCVGAALTVGSAFGFAACDNGTDPQGYDDPNIREVYSLYVASAEESGNEPMTYEEWLASIKGEDGAPGKDGKDGSSFLHGEGEPDAADGKAGDLYLDIVTGDLYEKTAEGWSSDPVGNLKGPQGEQGPKGDKGDSAAGGETEPADAIKTWDNVTIEANGTYTLDCKDVTPGLYWLVAEEVTGVEAAYGVLTVKTNTPTGAATAATYKSMTYDMYSSATSSFKGLVVVDESIATIEQPVVTCTSSSAISAKLKLVEYSPVEIKEGIKTEIPAFYMMSNESGRGILEFDSLLIGKSVKLTVSDYPTGTLMVILYKQTASKGAATQLTQVMISTGTTSTFTLPADTILSAGIGIQSTYGYNISITVESA